MDYKPRPLRAALTLSLLAVAALLALSGCGGGGSSKDARALIDKAFKNSIKSADMTLDIEAKIDGVPQLSQPVSLKVVGPFQSNGKGKLPSFDWKVSISGGGQALSGGISSTGDNAFVNFQGTSYELGAAQVARLNQQLAQQSGTGKSLKDFGIDAQSWIKDPQDKGTENVNGVDTTHVQGDVDIGKLLSDLNKTIQKAGSLGASAPAQLAPAQISAVQNVLKNPKLDIYVGKSDTVIRRLAVTTEFSVPSSARARFQGATGGTISFSIDFAKVGTPQTITAPANPHPISELQQQLGGLLGGLGGSGAGSNGPVPGGSGGAGGSGAGGSGSGSGGNPTPAQFQKYSKCVQAAAPSDTAAIQKCAQLLK